MTNKEEFISYLTERPNHIMADADTFLWARTSHYSEFASKNLGGGNFLIALGLFSTLSYIAKIYYLLNGKPTREKDDLIDETQAFKFLLNTTGIYLGLEKNQIVPAYKGLRHKLTHVIAPQEGHTLVANIIPDQPNSYEQAKKVAELIPNLPFAKSDSVLQLDVDLLNRDVRRMRDMVINELNTGKFDKNIDPTLAWIKKQLATT